MNNEVRVEFDAISENEAFARIAAAAFITPLNPTLEEISEAVTNAIIHGYEGKPGKVWLSCRLAERRLHIEVQDKGKGIEDVEKAMEPLFTTKPELDRSGMGFSFMEAFMDSLQVNSEPGSGTTVIMEKYFAPDAADEA